MGRPYETKAMRESKPILKYNGYYKIRTKGSHYTYSNGHNQITVNIRLNEKVRLRLIKENNLVVKKKGN